MEAVNLAFVNLPDLILMDIQLPYLSGLEVTRRLRVDDRSKEIPIIAVTAFAMGWHEREALDSGCEYGRIVPVAISHEFPTASLLYGVPTIAQALLSFLHSYWNPILPTIPSIGLVISCHKLGTGRGDTAQRCRWDHPLARQQTDHRRMGAGCRMARRWQPRS